MLASQCFTRSRQNLTCSEPMGLLVAMTRPMTANGTPSSSQLGARNFVADQNLEPCCVRRPYEGCRQR